MNFSKQRRRGPAHTGDCQRPVAAHRNRRFLTHLPGSVLCGIEHFELRPGGLQSEHECQGSNDRVKMRHSGFLVTACGQDISLARPSAVKQPQQLMELALKPR